MFQGCSAMIKNTARHWESHSKVCPALEGVRKASRNYAKTVNEQERQHCDPTRFVPCLNRNFGK